MSEQSSEEPRDPLEVTLQLRVPIWPDPRNRPSTSQRLQELEDHILLTAFWRGELALARHTALASLRAAQQQWAHFQPMATARKTDTAFEQAKRDENPGLYDRIMTGKQRVADLEHEMERLDTDAVRCNQAYGIEVRD